MTEQIKLPYDRVRQALEIAENGPGTCAVIPVLFTNGEIGDIIIERPKKGDKTITTEEKDAHIQRLEAENAKLKQKLLVDAPRIASQLVETKMDEARAIFENIHAREGELIERLEARIAEVESLKAENATLRAEKKTTTT